MITCYLSPLGAIACCDRSYARSAAISNRHFEASKGYFEASNRHFEASNRRFEASNRCFEAWKRLFEAWKRLLEASKRCLGVPTWPIGVPVPKPRSGSADSAAAITMLQRRRKSSGARPPLRARDRRARTAGDAGAWGPAPRGVSRRTRTISKPSQPPSSAVISSYAMPHPSARP